MLRTLYRTVAAAGTGNRHIRLNQTCRLSAEPEFFFVHRLKLLHRTNIVFHLLHGIHSGKHHHHALVACGKPERPGCIGRILMIRPKKRFRILRKIYQRASLHRLHYNYRLSMLSRCLITFPGLDAFIVPVQIIDLKLYYFNLRMRSQNLVQKLRLVMEGNSDMPDLSLCFFLLYKRKAVQFQRYLIVDRPLIMKQIIIKISATQTIQLIFKTCSCSSGLRMNSLESLVVST